MKRCFFAFVSIGIVGMALADSSANVVRNPGFENFSADGIVSDWDEPRKTFSYVKGEGRNGSTALKFVIGRKSSYSFPTQVVAVEPGKRYRFGAWVRAKNVLGKGQGASLYVICRNAEKKKLCNAVAHGVRGTVKDWREISFELDIPTNTVTCEFSPYVTKNRYGTAWFDDISCVQVDKPLILGELVSDVHRDTAAKGDVIFSAALSVDGKELAARGLKAMFDIPDVSGAVRAVDGEVTEKIVRVKVGVQTLPLGRSKISMRLVDKNAKVAECRSLEFNRVAEIPDWKVRIDEHNRFLVEGKPFFPVGVYLTYITEQAFLDISNSPFNCVMCYRRPTREQLDRFHSAGKKVIYSIKGVFLGQESCPKEIVDEKTEREWVEREVKKVKDHPALFAWYINDEFGPTWIDRLKERHELVSRNDPDHPTFMVLYQMNHLTEYAGTYDVLGTDPYPVGSRNRAPISMVEDWTRRTCRDAMGKAVLQVPQIFDNEVQNNLFPTKAPTEAEVKNMLWQCIVSGANGVCAFSYTSLRRKDKKDPFERRWAEVCRAYGEAVKYIPVLLSTEKAPKVSGMPQGVIAKAFCHEGKDWLFTVNMTYEPIDCCIAVGCCSAAQISLPALGVDIRKMPVACDE